MLKADILNQVGKIYGEGGNIMNFLGGGGNNTAESIMISYEFQAGSYVKLHNESPDQYKEYGELVARELNRLGSFGSVLEAGVGEAVTFKYVIDHMFSTYYAFDLSWSRLKVARDFIKDMTVTPTFFVAELMSIPMCDNAIDVVYSSHSIEPNHGFERSILQELYRVTKNYLVLFEPDYDYATDEGKAYMDQHGYIKNLADVARSLGYNIVKREKLDYAINNPLNPTSVIVIKKNSNDSNEGKDTSGIFQCPISKTQLIDCGEIFYAPSSKLMYPVIQSIPCLLDSNAILGNKYPLNQ